MRKNGGNGLVVKFGEYKKLAELATTMLNGGSRLIESIDKANQREMSPQEHNLMKILIRTNINRRRHGAKLLTILLPIDKRQALYQAICDIRSEEFKLLHSVTKDVEVDTTFDVNIADDEDFANFLVKETLDLRFGFYVNTNTDDDWKVTVS